MEAPAGRRVRWRLRAGSFVLLATVCSLLFAAPVYADPDNGETTSPPVEMTTEPAVPTAEPTSDPPPQPSTEVPTQETTTAAPPPPSPVRTFKMTVSKVELGDAYWQGNGSAKLVIAVKNTGHYVGNATINGFYAFPSGAHPAGAYGADGCVANNGSLSFRCTLAEGNVGKVVVKVDVDPGAWKLSETGTVNATSDGAPAQSSPIQIVFLTTPPTPGIDLSTSSLQLPAVASPRAESVQLQVKLRNTGTARGGSAVEVVTPPGVDLVSFQPVCKSHRRIAGDRDRCEFGDIGAGKDVSAAFGLLISAAARSEMPLTGAVHGYLTPIGRDTIETRSDYQISAPPIAGESPLPTDAPASPVAQATALGTGADPAKRERANGGLLTSEQLSSTPFIIGIIGLVALVGALVVFSLRRRMREDDNDELSDDEVEDVVLVPAPRAGEELVMTRSPIPRSLTLPRLPSGPVAGSGFRGSDVREADDSDE
jgi:hypothetical protein